MCASAKSVLVISDEPSLRKSRVALLQSEGYRVESVSSDDEAMALLEKKAFDLVLIGRNGTVSIEEVDQRLRHRRPQQCILKIEDPAGGEGHFATRNTDADPRHVLAAVKELLGK